MHSPAKALAKRARVVCDSWSGFVPGACCLSRYHLHRSPLLLLQATATMTLEVCHSLFCGGQARAAAACAALPLCLDAALWSLDQWKLVIAAAGDTHQDGQFPSVAASPAEGKAKAPEPAQRFPCASMQIAAVAPPPLQGPAALPAVISGPDIKTEVDQDQGTTVPISAQATKVWLDPCTRVSKISQSYCAAALTSEGAKSLRNVLFPQSVASKTEFFSRKMLS